MGHGEGRNSEASGSFSGLEGGIVGLVSPSKNKSEVIKIIEKSQYMSLENENTKTERENDK